jgi:uracil-DNA glycosylase family 4
MSESALRMALQAQIELAGDEIWFDEPWTPSFGAYAAPSARADHQPVARESGPQPSPLAHVGQFSINSSTPTTTEIDWSVWQNLPDLHAEIQRHPPYNQHQPWPFFIGQGPLEPALAVVCLSPTRTDWAASELFTGEEGVKLNGLLGKVFGLERSQCYLTSLSKSAWKRRLSLQEWRWMRGGLIREMELVQPKAILVLGLECATRLLERGADFTELAHQDLRIAGAPWVATFGLGDFVAQPHLAKEALPHLLELKARMA